MNRIKVTITIVGPKCAPDSAEASRFLDLVESAWDAGHGHMSMGRGFGNLLSHWWFSVKGGETRHMPEEEDVECRR
jgi:hypothetical protein